MKLRHWLAGALSLRRALTHLGGIHTELERTNALLARLANHFAPQPAAPPVPAALREELSAISHLDVNEAFLAQEYVRRTQLQTGYAPTDDEIALYLADEKTIALQERLVARDQQVATIEDRRAGRTL